MSTSTDSPVPHFTTALTGPLLLLERQILDRQSAIESWFRSQWRRSPAPFYASVDLRNSGYKVAPVDTNLFPAGFNNLNPAFDALSIQALQQAVEHLGAPVDRIVIVPESHTRNLFYLENLAVLQRLLERAGFAVRLGSLLPELKEETVIPLPSGASARLAPLVRNGRRVMVGDFDPDFVLLNNDLSSGTPALIEDIEQMLRPAPKLGWANRLKSVHFSFYQGVAREFAALLGIDPWFIDPMFRNCGAIDFMKREGQSCLERNVEELLEAITHKYAEYSVQCRPFVMVKADAGTYGMGVMSAHSVAEVVELNRKQRTKMSTTKEGQKVSKVIIQEGVYTHETWGEGNAVAEPVVYMIDHNVVGGFYRVHTERSSSENLNAPGMRFEPLAFEECCITPDPAQGPDAHLNRFYTYGVIGRLALLAAARESQSVA
ncbi:MAG: glutamate--cysteine ligase [Gammaproteobacteria bacterium RIFCSPLOWO2_02_FULL_61_13]|nr:MAG: glutamate--cysteine ligase [Gammaproteobacteria bacterium RIFCSPLOWO2_02_FULL_61_13]